MQRLLPVVLFTLAFGCQATPSGSRSATGATQEPSLDQAKQLALAGNYDEALLVTDALLARNPDDPAARLLAADANLALAQTRKDNVQGLLLDAVSNLEHVVRVRPDDAMAWQRLAGAYLMTASFAKGRDAGLKAANILRQRKASEAEVAAALLTVADNEMQVFVDARQAEIARDEPAAEDTALKANAVLGHLALAKRGLPGKAVARIARVYQWLGQHESALAELERGIDADPAESEVHIVFQDTMLGSDRRAECVAAYKRILERQRDNPTVLFYLGRAQFSAADGLRARGQWDEAGNGYAEAKATFARYIDKRPDHRATATHWQAMCELSRARMALDRGDLARAKELYFAAHATDARVLAKDENGVAQIVDSFGGTYAGGLFMLGTAIAQGSSAESLRHALAFFEEVIAKHPDAIGQFYNNAGLAARDLGAAVAPSDARQAMELWERSYRHYEKAVALVPDDPRIVNDCGLMLVYHLKRDYDKAKVMFAKAIELGEAQIAALPADASEEQRNFLEEAVGDAYQNLAVMARQQGRPFADYRANLEKAVQFYPGARRTAAELLRTQGGDVQGLPGSTGPSLTPAERKQREQLANAAAAAQAAAAAGDFDGAIAALAANEKDLGGLDAYQTLVARYAKSKEQGTRFRHVADAAQKAVADEDYDAALVALDSEVRALDGYAPFHALVGRYSLAYARQARDKGGKASQISGLFADATAQLARARELDGESSETRFLLAQALADTGKFEDARKEATSLLSHIRSVGHAGGVDLLAVHRLRAEACTRAYIDAKQAGTDDQDALRGARESLRFLAESDKVDGKTLQVWLGLEQWAGAPAQALEVATKAMRSASAPADVLEQGLALAAQLGQSDKVVAVLRGSQDPTRQWYLGKALFTHAQELWATDLTAALAALDDCVTAFAAAKAGNAAFADTCDQWTALGLGSKGVMLLGADKNAEAEAALLASIRLRPDCAGKDLGGGNSSKRALLVLGGKLQRDLGKFESLMRAATEAVPSDVDFANNHGLAARDLGNRLEREGDAAGATAMYEASYASYTRASNLDRDNIRLRNDTALMLIYHLHRDLDAAVATLASARDDGLRRLQESPPSTPQERQDLEEAVGDCIENLGYYYQTHAKDNGKAIAHYKQSLAYYPKAERAASRRLRALEPGDGK